jgi:antirestriction protein ArdC
MKTQNRTRTAEDRKVEAERLHESIVEQVAQLTETGQWRRFLDFAKSFHNFSLNNLLLILAQNPDATKVAGYRQWQANGRQVRKGETSIKIFGYREKKTTEPDDIGDNTSTADPRKRTSRYFPILAVFDISQTDPIDKAEPVPENPARELQGSDDHGVTVPLMEHLHSSGWTVTREPLARANGYADPTHHVIVLDSGLAPEQAAKTLIHETAHIHLGHVDDLDEYRQHRGRMEVEAESVAYIVAGLSGFNTSAYSIGYITGWANENTQLIRDTATRVLKTADKIIGTISPAQ